MSSSEGMTTTLQVDVLLEAIPDPAFVCREDGLAIIAANQLAVDKYGYSRSEFEKMDLTALSPPQFAEKLKTRLSQAGAGAKVRESSVHELANGDTVSVDMALCGLGRGGEGMMLVLVRETGLHAGVAGESRLIETCCERINDVVIVTEANENDLATAKIVYVNQAFVKRTGYSRQEAIGDTPRILQGVRTQRKTLDRIRKALENKRPVRAELINYTKSGAEFWVELEITPVSDSTGNIINFVAVQRDITGRIAGAQDLVEESARYRAVAEAATDIICDWDLEDNAIWWSKSYSTAFGYPLIEQQADPQASWIRRIHVKDRQAIENSVQDAIAQKKKHWRASYLFVHSDGREIPVEHRASVIADENHNAVRFTGGMTILREEDKASPKLRKLAARLSQQVELVRQIGSSSFENEKALHSLISSSAQTLLDADGGALALIQGDSLAYVAAQGLGASRRSTIAPLKPSLSQANPQKNAPVIYEDVLTAMDWDAEAWRDSGVQSAITTVLMGSVRPLAIIKVLSKKKRAFSKEDADTLQLFAQSASAVLERRQLEVQLRNSQRLQSLGQLTGGIAHDFNNLLTVILGSADTLAAKYGDNTEISQIASLTKAAAERGGALTGRLLAFARQQPLDPKTTDLNKLVTGMDALIDRSIGSNIQVEIVRGAGLWDALIDAAQLENAILNLCINARDAMPHGGKLTIELANTHLSEDYADREEEVLPGQYVMIAVSDTGTGISPEIRSRVFDPFFTTKAPGRGSGLGLSMVFGFIKQSRGHIKIYSEIGEGTTVRLYLPRAAPYVSAEAKTSTDPAERYKVKILLVEDDDLVRGHILSQLRALGYQVIEARNGHEALEAVRQISDFDLLFTDVVMPGGMSGKEVAAEVLSLRPAMKVLFTSGYTQNAIVHGGKLDAGINFISKPFRQVDLERKINQILFSEQN